MRREVHRHPAADQPTGSRHRSPGLGDRGARRRHRGGVVLRGTRIRRVRHRRTPHRRRGGVVAGGDPRVPRRIDQANPALHRRHRAVAARPGPGRRGLRHGRRAVRRACRPDHRQGEHGGTIEGLRLHERRPVGAQPRELRTAPPAAARGARHLEGCLPASARRVHVAPPADPTADPRLARQCDVHAVDRPGRQVGRSRCSRPMCPVRSSSTRHSSTTTANAGSTTGAIPPTRSSARARPGCTSIATRDAPSRSSGRATTRSRRSPADSAFRPRSPRSRTRSSAGRTSWAARRR